MQLDSIAISPRTRSPWSAIDLGFKLGLKHFVPCFLLWCILATPFAMLLGIFFSDQYWVMTIAIWWLKPLFERPLLFLLSRELFSEKTSIRDTLKAFKSWLNPGWLMAITLGRISFSRSFFLPLSVLEKLTGKPRNARINALSSSLGSESAWLTIVLVHIESFLLLGMLGLLELITPEQANLREIYLGENISMVLIQFLAFAVVAPFYVAAGFILYISRRIELEGWDIELQFRNWIAKNAN